VSALRREIAAHLPALARWRGENARAWLFAILTNLNRSRLRADAALAMAEPDRLDRVEAAVTEPALRLGVDRALASLAPEQREVLLMVALEGFSYAEAASALGVPPGTVTSRLSRARAAFRAALEGRPDKAPFRRVKR
jgi:RNA polymerase sigma-70 factor (ECF subfamily)